MKSLKVPFVEGLDSMMSRRFEMTMESEAARTSIGTVNWPDYPYRPRVSFMVARSSERIYIMYYVTCLDLRATVMEDNGPVWEDSCCEFFVADPTDGTYYNFELNCIGTLLAAKRTGRNDAVHFGPEAMKRIVRQTSLPREACDVSGRIFRWSASLGIPFDLIGVDRTALPPFLMANFYKCADGTGHPHFLSWNPIENAPEPDFHRPDCFGKLYL